MLSRKKSKKRQNNRVKRPDRRLFLTSWMPFLSQLQTKLVQMYLLLMNNLRKREAGNAKTAASRARNTVKKETERKDNKDITVFENGNNNEKILEMSRAGKSNMEIAKTLGIGTGEVKLVVDLFKGGR